MLVHAKKLNWGTVHYDQEQSDETKRLAPASGALKRCPHL
jgi:hypothetical protein